MLVAITCKHLQRDLDQYRDQIEERGLAVVAPEIPGQELAGQDLIDSMAGVIGVVAGDDQFTGDVLRSLPDLQAISKWGIGLDGIDLDAAAEHGVVVTNTPGMFNHEVAEMALGYLIAAVRGIVSTDRAVRQGGWPNPVGRSLVGKKIAVVALGNIGFELASKLTALGMSVLGIDPSPDVQGLAREAGFEMADIDSGLRDADAVIVTAPLNQHTHHLINADRLALMRDDSFLINVGRGQVVDNQALADVLAAGRLSGVALDVFEAEPLPTDSPLREFDNCILGTHNSSNTLEACHRTHQAAIDNLLHSLDRSTK